MILLFTVLLIFVLLFLLVRVSRLRRFFHESTKIDLYDTRKELLSQMRKVINPITYDNRTYYKIFKLSNQLKNKNFFKYDLKNYTVFIKREQ